MVNHLHTQEEAIQRDWIKEAERLGDAGEMVTDGLLFRGPIAYGGMLPALPCSIK